MSNNRQIQTDFGKDGGMSLFIPYAHDNTNEVKVRKVFDYLGTIRLVKFLSETNKTTGKKYKMVYVYFEKWNETKKTRKFQKNVQADGAVEGCIVDGSDVVNMRTSLHEFSDNAKAADLHGPHKARCRWAFSFEIRISASSKQRLDGCQTAKGDGYEESALPCRGNGVIRNLLDIDEVLY